MLPSDQSRIIEQAKFTYSPLGKAIEKQIKTIKDQGKKKVETLKALKPEENQELESIERVFPKKIRNNENKNKIGEIKKWEEKIKKKDLKYDTKNTYMIFSNMKQQNLFVIIFILAKLI